MDAAEFLGRIAWGAVAQIVAVLAMFFFGLSIHALWRRYRRPHWAKTPAQIGIPGGRWIVIGLIVAVLVYLAVLVAQDPLRGP
jgi:hypothetical protein